MNFLPDVDIFRRYLLYLVFALTLLAVLLPPLSSRGDRFEYIFIVDITRSMNVEDYSLNDLALSRLDFSKRALIDGVRSLPCGSRAGLGVFTERQTTLLFSPIEVCENFGEIVGSVRNLHWGMAWAADSRVAKGLYSALELLQDFDANLVFLTDGHEAPPLNPRYRTSFQDLKGKIPGIIMGIGGLTPMPIPKFDNDGHQVGFYSAEEVPHRSSFGLSHLDPSKIKGYNRRNAPFGSEHVTGTEHLSALRERYLQKLAAQSGLDYHRLVTFDQFGKTIRSRRFARSQNIQADFAWMPASVALGLLILLYPGGYFLARRTLIRSVR